MMETEVKRAWPCSDDDLIRAAPENERRIQDSAEDSISLHSDGYVRPPDSNSDSASTSSGNLLEGTNTLDLLPDYLDTDELPDLLGRTGFIPRTARNRICHEEKRITRSLQLVRILGDRVTQQPFLDALEATGQKHIANFIRSRAGISLQPAELPDEYGHDWPLSSEQLYRLDVIQKEWGKLIASDELIWRLRDGRCISSYQYEELINISKPGRRVNVLIEIIKQKSQAMFNVFMTCLNVTDQTEALMVLDTVHDYFNSHRLTAREGNTDHQTQRALGDVCLFHGFVFDVLEPILLLAIVLLREILRRKSNSQNEAECKALTTIMTVCKHWLDTVTLRPYSRRQLKKRLRILPQTVASVRTRCRKIRGVALLDGRLYVIGRRSNDVKVFSSIPPCTKQLEIHVPSLKWPRDMVACPEEQCLYITDNCPETNCIWRVNVSPTTEGDVVTNWIRVPRDMYEPWMISGTTSRLIVLPWVGKNIYVYGTRGELLYGTALPGYYDARHAIETRTGTFFVADIEGPKSNIQEDRVTEVTSTGKEIHAYGKKRGNGPGQLSDPYHLALDSDGRVLVADHDNDRIILLNSDLTFCRQLLTRQDDHQSGEQRRVDQLQVALMAEPRRLCYDKQSGMLAVGLQGGHVNLYEWKH